MNIDVNSLADGALLERLNIELQRMAENITDPNTKADAVRTVTVEIKVKPDETRSIAVTEINVKSKLAPPKGIPTKFVVDRDSTGKAVIAELKSGAKGQMMIDDDGDVADDRGRKVNPPEDSGKVVKFK